MSGAASNSNPIADLKNVQLRLYVARSTPNSIRAEANLAAMLQSLDNQPSQESLEIIDVFLQPRRAITDGIIVTPTLIGLNKTKRFVLMGDLADRAQLAAMLCDLWVEDAATRST
jgi:hypothetical protein